MRPETRGIIPLDGFHVPKSLRKTIRQKPVRHPLRYRFRRRRSTAAPKSARSADRPGSTRRSAKPISQLHRIGPLPFGRGLARGAAGRRALRRVARRGLLRRKHVFAARRMPRRSASSIWSSGCKRARLRAARHAVHHRAPEALRRHRRAARQISKRCWPRRLNGERQPRSDPLSGSARPCGAVGLVARPGPARRTSLAALQPDVIDGVLDGVEAGAFGKHPAGEDAADLAVERDLVDLDEGIGLRLPPLSARE